MNLNFEFLLGFLNWWDILGCFKFKIMQIIFYVRYLKTLMLYKIIESISIHWETFFKKICSPIF